MIARERAAEQEAKDAALIEQMEDVQARMDADELLAARLQEQERKQFSVDEQARFLVETIAVRKKFFSAQRATEIRNRPPTKTQLRNQMITYLKHIGKYTHNQSKSKSLEEIQKLYKKEYKKRPRAEHNEESVKKQKLQDNVEKEELRACLDIVQGDDIAINVESLATKYPIVDWKIHILTENMMYYQIIRANGSFKNYKIFSEMLDDFDIQDVMDLHRLEDEVWRNQQGYNLISWRLFDSCGVHVLLMDNGIAIHMMIEKKYPLTQEMLSRMLNRRLEVDHESEMAFELLRFTRSQLKKIDKDGRMGYFKLIRDDGSLKRYSSMIKMLQGIDREDLETLWKLVKAKHENTRPERIMKECCGVIRKEVPIFDELEPQPQPLLNCLSLDASLGNERGPRPPIKPPSPDSFRMKEVDHLTIHIPPSPHVASFHLKDTYCYYHPCIDDPKKYYGFKPGLLRRSESLGVDFSNMEMIEDDWELEPKEVSFLGRRLNFPVRPKEVENVKIKETHHLEHIIQQPIFQHVTPSHNNGVYRYYHPYLNSSVGEPSPLSVK
ncbi:hypothetical protein Tco_0204250 [Tanacetum coccineum]